MEKYSCTFNEKQLSIVYDSALSGYVDQCVELIQPSGLDNLLLVAG